MSGNREEAKAFRLRFDEAMKLGAFRDDEECLGFAREVKELFRIQSDFGESKSGGEEKVDDGSENCSGMPVTGA